MNPDSSGFENPDDGMERCQITGKLAPRDEIVDLHGFRVCAEGKAELLRRIRTGQAMPGEMITPTIGARLVALMVDGLFYGAIGLIGGAAIASYDFQHIMGVGGVPRARENAIELMRFQGGLSLMIYGTMIAYLTILHGMKGQTLGKMAARIIVVDLAGNLISYKTAFARALYYQGLTLLSPLPMLLMNDAEAMTLVSGGFAMLAGLWGLADTIAALADRAQQRSLHDKLAATRVIVKP